MSTPSNEMHKQYLDANSKADHFLLGAIVAACAYLAQSNPYAPLGMNPQTLFLIDLIVLGLAAFFAYRRVENAVQVIKYNAMFLEGFENRNEAKFLEGRRLANDYAESTILHRHVRNSLIALGFVLYVTAKIWMAYKLVG
ncbi:hypothetical protein PSH90_03430 [Pseudomonas sp. FP1762]|uniref:hypothetical protein n=1 Tax=Pseudomonas sp. FP1762 TaxID=2954080 RepID=UPI0027339D79|nr:hypothetical protein [Pseudomonas sp. FP1762]WLG63176.1 hypothetical protein PSH90_03430 [Pseudomonas sp. FP1762]